MAKVIRIWADELERLPEYSLTYPTGVCNGKTWKIRGHKGEWSVGQYREINGVMWVMFFRVVLLSGPRRVDERFRFRMSCL